MNPPESVRTQATPDQRRSRRTLVELKVLRFGRENGEAEGCTLAAAIGSSGGGEWVGGDARCVFERVGSRVSRGANAGRDATSGRRSPASPRC